MLVGALSTVIVHHNTGAYEHSTMITFGKRFRSPRTRKALVPAFLFLAAATFSATGSGAMAVLCLVPAGFALELGRDDERSHDKA